MGWGNIVEGKKPNNDLKCNVEGKKQKNPQP